MVVPPLLPLPVEKKRGAKTLPTPTNPTSTSSSATTGARIRRLRRGARPVGARGGCSLYSCEDNGEVGDSSPCSARCCWYTLAGMGRAGDASAGGSNGGWDLGWGC